MQSIKLKLNFCVLVEKLWNFRLFLPRHKSPLHSQTYVPFPFDRQVNPLLQGFELHPFTKIIFY